jgi:nucleoside-diphosphate-sugar epimerase
MVTALALLKGKDYSGLRGRRVAEFVGSQKSSRRSIRLPRFLDVIAANSYLLCQHAARTGDYRNAEFDVTLAVADNTHNLPVVLKAMLDKGLAGVIVTGSVFEQDEGAGNAPLRAFSPYGLSKGLTWQYQRFLSETMHFSLGKFVIPNPFGPFEEPRFCNYLIQSWLRGEVPSVRTPLYVRDNVHVDLLAAAYAAFAQQVPSRPGISKLNPSFYVESQGAFANRFATEMQSRLNIACPVSLLEQAEFAEPMVRVNTDRIDGAALGWKEGSAWDAEAEFYASQFRR